MVAAIAEPIFIREARIAGLLEDYHDEESYNIFESMHDRGIYFNLYNFLIEKERMSNED